MRTLNALIILLALGLLASCGRQSLEQTAAAQTQTDPSGNPEAQPGQPAVQAEQTPAPQVSIPEGTVLRVRLDQTLDTRRNRGGDRFFATLSEPVTVDGNPAIPAGTRFNGHVVEAKPSGRLKGRARMSLSLDSFELNGATYDIRTARLGRSSGGHKKRNWLLIGGGTGTGAAFGVIGGPVGVAVGAGAGAAVGTTSAVITGKKNVRLPVETRLGFTLLSTVAL
jgi:hypothetical protein